MTSLESPPPRRRWLRLILARLPYYVGIPLSLLVFPSMVPWVFLCWIAAYIIPVVAAKPGNPWGLSIPIVMILVKNLDVDHSLLILVALIAVGGTPWPARWMQRHASPRAIAIATATLLILSWSYFSYRWHVDVHRSGPLTLRVGRPILVIGDSLSVHGWPGVLARQISVPVIDRSEGGINTVEGLVKLPEALALHPQLVIVELGGHDYLEKRGKEAARANLVRMIDASRAAGAEVLLFEVPRGFVYDSFGGIERQLARKYDLELVTDGAIRQLVYFSPFTPLGSLTGRKLSDDGLHPNDAGHRFLAERVKESLVRLYGTSILAAPR